MRRLELLVLAIPFLMAAGSDPRKLCEEEWPKQKNPSRADSKTCTRYWFEHYCPELDEDCGAYGEVVTLYTAEEFRNMAAHVVQYDKANGEGPTAADRVSELFGGAAESHFKLFDIGRMESIEPLLKKIFDGRRLEAEEIEHCSEETLFKLRNAVYARHGRPFKNPDLQTFFYGKRDVQGDSEETDLLPRKPNPAFKESDLDAADRANAALIAKAEPKRRKKK
jgi:hypothetical protein